MKIAIACIRMISVTDSKPHILHRHSQSEYTVPIYYIPYTTHMYIYVHWLAISLDSYTADTWKIYPKLCAKMCTRENGNNKSLHCRLTPKTSDMNACVI